MWLSSLGFWIEEEPQKKNCWCDLSEKNNEDIELFFSSFLYLRSVSIQIFKFDDFCYVSSSKPFFGKTYLAAVPSDGSKGGSYGPKFSQYHAVFSKIWQNRMLEGWRHLLRAILDQPLVPKGEILCWVFEIFFLWLKSPMFYCSKKKTLTTGHETGRDLAWDGTWFGARQSRLRTVIK